jgi:glycerol-3-phosphate dehydrogenase (NAD(P)+)
LDKQAAIIGLGNWGTALGNHLSHKGLDVLGWSIESSVVESINQAHRHPRFMTEVLLHSEFKATLSLEEALQRRVLVLVLPAVILGRVIPKMKTRADALVISAVKGIVGDSLLTPLQFYEEHGTPCSGLAVISGPSFARDVVVHRPCGIVAASKDQAAARLAADLFSCEWMRVYTCGDPLGVELGGITKNVIALAAGVCDGMELGDSARAGLITRGLAEMMRLAKAMGADLMTLSGLSGLGDLVMTATCDTSRNRTVGLRLGRGESLSHILETLGSVAEGVETTPHVVALAQKYQIEMPITEQVAKLLKGEMAPREMVKALVSRPLKREFEWAA